MAISKNLTIMQMNDSHTYLDLHQELLWNGDPAEYRKAGGKARIATALNRVLEERRGQRQRLTAGIPFMKSSPLLTHFYLIC